MVSQLRNVKEVGGKSAHELTGSVAVKVVEGELLHMAEQIPPDIRLYQDAKGVAPVADDVGQQRPQHKGHAHHCHHGEEGPVGAFRQQLVHAPAGDVGEGQVNDGDQQRAAKVRDEQSLMGPEIGQENL